MLNILELKSLRILITFFLLLMSSMNNAFASYCGGTPGVAISEPYFQGYTPNSVDESIISGNGRMGGYRIIKSSLNGCGPNDSEPASPKQYCKDVNGDGISGKYFNCDWLFFGFDKDGLIKSALRTRLSNANQPYQAAVPGIYIAEWGLCAWHKVTCAFGGSCYCPWDERSDAWSSEFVASGWSIFVSPLFMYSKFKLERTNEDKFFTSYSVTQVLCNNTSPTPDGACGTLDRAVNVHEGWHTSGSANFTNPTDNSGGVTQTSSRLPVTHVCVGPVMSGATYKHGGVNNTQHDKICAYVSNAQCDHEIAGYGWAQAFIGCVDQLKKPAPPLYRKTLSNSNAPILETTLVLNVDQGGGGFFRPRVLLSNTQGAVFNSLTLTLYSPIDAAYSANPDPAYPSNTCKYITMSNGAQKNHCCGNLTYKDGSQQDVTTEYCITNAGNDDKVAICSNTLASGATDTECKSGIYLSQLPKQTLKTSNAKLLLFADYCLNASTQKTPYLRPFFAQSDYDGNLYYRVNGAGPSIALNYNKTSKTYVDSMTGAIYQPSDITKKFMTGNPADGTSSCYCFDNNICPYDATTMTSNTLVPAFQYMCGVQLPKIFEYYDQIAGIDPATAPTPNTFSVPQTCSSAQYVAPSTGNAVSSSTTSTTNNADGSVATSAANDNCSCIVSSGSTPANLDATITSAWSDLGAVYATLGDTANVFPNIPPQVQNITPACPTSSVMRPNAPNLSALEVCTAQNNLIGICKTLDAAVNVNNKIKAMSSCAAGQIVCPLASDSICGAAQYTQSISSTRAASGAAGPLSAANPAPAGTRTYASTISANFAAKDSSGNTQIICDWAASYTQNQSDYANLACDASQGSTSSSSGNSGSSSSSVSHLLHRQTYGATNYLGTSPLFGLKFTSLVTAHSGASTALEPSVVKILTPRAGANGKCIPAWATPIDVTSMNYIPYYQPVQTRNQSVCSVANGSWNLGICNVESEPQDALLSLTICPGLYTPSPGSSDIICLESENAFWTDFETEFAGSYSHKCAKLPQNGCAAEGRNSLNQYIDWAQMAAGTNTTEQCTQYNPSLVSVKKTCPYDVSSMTYTPICSANLSAYISRTDGASLCTCPDPATVCHSNNTPNTATHYAMWDYDLRPGDTVTGYCNAPYNTSATPIISCGANKQLTIQGTCDYCHAADLRQSSSLATDSAAFFYHSWNDALQSTAGETKMCNALGESTQPIIRTCTTDSNNQPSSHYSYQCANPCAAINSSNSVVNQVAANSQYLAWTGFDLNQSLPQKSGTVSCPHDPSVTNNMQVYRKCEFNTSGDIVSNFYNATTNTVCPATGCCSNPCAPITTANSQSYHLTWDQSLDPVTNHAQAKTCISGTGNVTRSCKYDATGNYSVVYSSTCPNAVESDFAVIPQGTQCYNNCDAKCYEAFGGQTLPGVPFDLNADIISLCNMYCKSGYNFNASQYRTNQPAAGDATSFLQLSLIPAPTTPYVITQSTYNGVAYKMTAPPITSVAGNCPAASAAIDWDTGVVVTAGGSVTISLDNDPNSPVYNGLRNEVVLCGHDVRFSDYIGDQALGSKFFFAKNSVPWYPMLYVTSNDDLKIRVYGYSTWSAGITSAVGGIVTTSLGNPGSSISSNPQCQWGVPAMDPLRSYDYFYGDGWFSSCSGVENNNPGGMYQLLGFDRTDLTSNPPFKRNHSSHVDDTHELFSTNPYGLLPRWGATPGPYMYKYGFVSYDGIFNPANYTDNTQGYSLRVERKGCRYSNGDHLEYGFASVGQVPTQWYPLDLSKYPSGFTIANPTLPSGLQAANLFIRVAALRYANGSLIDYYAINGAIQDKGVASTSTRNFGVLCNSDNVSSACSGIESDGTLMNMIYKNIDGGYNLKIKSIIN